MCEDFPCCGHDAGDCRESRAREGVLETFDEATDEQVEEMMRLQR